MPALKQPNIEVSRLPLLAAPAPAAPTTMMAVREAAAGAQDGDADTAVETVVETVVETAIDAAEIRHREQMEHDNVQLASLTPVSVVPPAPPPPPPPSPPSVSRATTGTVKSAPASPSEVARRPAWRRFAAPAPLIEGRGRVAIVLDDMGLSQFRSDRAIALPRPVTLAILPYGNQLHGLVARARTAGHEVMLHLPMEPVSARVDPGPNALLTGLPEAELDRRIATNLARLHGYVGINNHMGSRFTASPRAMRRVMRALRERELLFLDSMTSARSTGYRLAREFGIPTVARDIFLDNDRAPDQIRRQLDLTAARARKYGHAVAIGHPYPETLDALESWLPRLADLGLVLVPVSALATLGDGSSAPDSGPSARSSAGTSPAQLGLAHSTPTKPRATP